MTTNAFSSDNTNCLIDLRSDTLTLPTSGMRETMANAAVGDDVYGEDPTINELEQYAAELSGKEAALFLPSATQANLTAILSHCERGDEYIAGSTAHCYLWEGGGASVLGGVQAQPIDFEEDGTIDLNKVRRKIKPENVHFVKTKLLCIENTTNGKALPFEYLARTADFCKEENLLLHMDGARVFNAIIHYGKALKEVAEPVDSLTICLSKGLGAPGGALLCGSQAFIKRARRWRKVLGGGFRQGGFLAAAGLYALKHNVDRLSEDHANANKLFEGLKSLNSPLIVPLEQNTNMVFVKMDGKYIDGILEELKINNVLLGKFYFVDNIVRIVTHLGISVLDIECALQTFQKILNNKTASI
ncbi:MAG: low-specificity L-threonine aldolase [Verrucomicrobia bacterium CG_4_10_14_3_um_filter_43_23]|nr:MAG: low-specificity L-threonine aldolase [Verrucomicrobia bacterium CG1_02_43_26]PIP59541.1 MAG: low-specificity L-threonine aldolase [Verrucomicrobia bacterium CG22_combo_CG10-13_8_21_14_all_43_17]PIX58842.1 MAG: low-specificity L-threonine aldolase [Verrucomicrobia bacterium CG_4_10_14_3_um_filter_43_23]PIY60937.1 MAG: low-specificity L-threonine aldolase [Verrucomicrobia bacterium CG_4_10_14_0_8_um_filter_43_34]PJA44851.1 MAG: low-specificity L-threonine aldolase [Verrucomicrobia bacteri